MCVIKTSHLACSNILLNGTLTLVLLVTDLLIRAIKFE
jgi:hypothetical protein